MAKSKTQPRNVKAAEKAHKAFEMRKAGATYKQIGAALGFSPQYAYECITKNLGKMRKDMEQTIEDVREMELERLDGLLLGQWPRAKGGDSQAANTVVRIMERRSKVMGLDAPAKIDATQTVVWMDPDHEDI